MNIDLYSILGNDDPLLGIEELRVALAPPGKRVCRKTISRYLNNRMDPLPTMTIANRKVARLSVAREWLLRKEQRRNPPRDTTRNAKCGASHGHV
jgi:hypothetical protein